MVIGLFIVGYILFDGVNDYKINRKIETQESNEFINQNLDRDTSTEQYIAYRFSLINTGWVNSSYLINKLMQQPRSQQFEKQLFEASFSGEIHFSYLDESEGLPLFQVQLNDLVTNTTITEQERQWMMLPFLVSIGEQGLLILNKPELIYSEQLKSLIGQILPYFHVFASKSQELNWQTRELDSLGVSLNSYRVQSNHSSQKTREIQKTKVQYLELNLKDGLFSSADGALNVAVVNSDTKYSVVSGAIWAESINLKESLLSKSDNLELSETTAVFICTQINRRISFSSASLSTIKPQRELMGIEQFYITNPELNQLVLNKNLKEVTQLFEELLHDNEDLALDMLINYLRLHPEQSNNLVDYIFDASALLTQQVDLRLWYSLATSGHQEAQLALIYAASEPRFNSLIKYRAITYIQDIEFPTEVFIDQLSLLRKNLSAFDDIENQELANMALFALGSMGGNDKLNQMVKYKVADILADSLPSISSDQEAITLLTAIANTGNTDLIPVISEMFNNPNGKVKAAAFDALSNMEGKQVIDLFVEEYERINELELQEYAVKVMLQMPETSEKNQWIAAQVQKSTNSTLNQLFIKGLGANLSNYPENESILRNLLIKELTVQEKMAIYKYIPPKL